MLHRYNVRTYDRIIHGSKLIRWPFLALIRATPSFAFALLVDEQARVSDAVVRARDERAQLVASVLSSPAFATLSPPLLTSQLGRDQLSPRRGRARRGGHHLFQLHPRRSRFSPPFPSILSNLRVSLAQCEPRIRRESLHILCCACRAASLAVNYFDFATSNARESSLLP